MQNTDSVLQSLSVGTHLTFFSSARFSGMLYCDITFRRIRKKILNKLQSSIIAMLADVFPSIFDSSQRHFRFTLNRNTTSKIEI